MIYVYVYIYSGIGICGHINRMFNIIGFNDGI